MKTLNQQWREYAEKVYPDGASLRQEEECQQAFFCGAMSILATLRDDVSKLSDDEGVVCLNSYWDECGQFTASRLVKLMVKQFTVVPVKGDFGDPYHVINPVDAKAPNPFEGRRFETIEEATEFLKNFFRAAIPKP